MREWNVVPSNGDQPHFDSTSSRRTVNGVSSIEHQVGGIALAQEAALVHVEQLRRRVRELLHDLRRRQAAFVHQFQRCIQRVLHQRQAARRRRVGARFFFQRVRCVVGGEHVDHVLGQRADQRFAVGWRP